MKQAAEYREHARECRALARGMSPGSSHDGMQAIADTWERLARYREENLQPQPQRREDGDRVSERH